jgi:hypothetical protein
MGSMSNEQQIDKKLENCEREIRALAEQYSNEVLLENATGKTTMRASNATKYKLQNLYKERDRLKLLIFSRAPSRYEKTAKLLLEKSLELAEVEKNLSYYQKSIEQMAGTILRNYKDADSREQLLADLSSFKSAMIKEQAHCASVRATVAKLQEKLIKIEEKNIK